MLLTKPIRKNIEQKLVNYYTAPHLLSVGWIYVIQKITMNLGDDIKKEYIVYVYKYGYSNEYCSKKIPYSKSSLKRIKKEVLYDIMAFAMQKGLIKIKL